MRKMNGNTEYGLLGKAEKSNTRKDLKRNGEIGPKSELVSRCFNLLT